MKISWHGTATLTIQGTRGKILFDPFLRRNEKLSKIDVKTLAKADAAFITHPHFDHFCDIESFFNAGLPVAYVCRQGIENGKKYGFKAKSLTRLKEILAGESVTVGDLTVTAYLARHSKLDIKTVCDSALRFKKLFQGRAAAEMIQLHTKFPIDGATYAYGVTDGEKTALIFGSAGFDKNVAYPKKPNLLVFPYQGCSHLEKLACEITGLLTPKRVMFDHYEDAFPPITAPQDKTLVLKELNERYPDTEAFFPKENAEYTI